MISPLDGTLFGPGQPCFGCGPDHPHGFRLKYERDGDGVLARFTPGERYQGPPGIMHGGLVATVADETAAWALIAKTGKFGFTTGFECTLHRAVRIGVETEARARLVRESPRIVRSEVRLSQGGEPCFSGLFTFAVLDRHGAEKLLGGPLPEAWLRFCR